MAHINTYPGYSDAYAGPFTHPHRKSKLIPDVHFTLDDREVPMTDWLATTIANGGYDTFRGVIPERYVKRNPSFIQGAMLRAMTESGQVIWEGRMLTNPAIRSGLASIAATGFKAIADKHFGRLLFQSRDVGLWTTQDSTPHNTDSAATIRAGSSGGELHFEVNKSESLTAGDEIGFALWAQGSKLRYFRANVQLTPPSNQGVELRLYKASGPSGARTQVGSISATGTWSVDLTSSPTDMLILTARAGNTLTTTAGLRYVVRNIRVNGLITEDSAEVHKIAKVVGQKCGYDVEGIQTGIPIGTATPEIWTRRYEFPQSMTPQEVARAIADPKELQKYAVDTVQPAVVTSAQNLLPLDWQSGSWSSLLDYLASILDWRWRVIGNVFGTGPVLQFGPWSNVWAVDTAEAQPELAPLELFNEVVLKYVNASGVMQEIRKRADPDPLAVHGVINQFEHQLQDVQVSDATANAIASHVVERLSSPRYAGSISIVDADDLSGRGNCYSVLAGDLLYVSDWGPKEALTVRVMQTEMGPLGTRIGIEQPVSVAASLALQAAAAQRASSPLFRVFLPAAPTGLPTSGGMAPALQPKKSLPPNMPIKKGK